MVLEEETARETPGEGFSGGSLEGWIFREEILGVSPARIGVSRESLWVGGPGDVQGPLMRGSVINLSQRLQLTPTQFSLLDRGLSFIPSHLVGSVDKASLLAELSQLHIRMQRAVYFDSSLEAEQMKPFKVASGWIPPPQRLPSEIWDFF
ncbi:MAG: hypothetical protein ACRDC4_04675, partial [Plesiomonas sp.]